MKGVYYVEDVRRPRGALLTLSGCCSGQAGKSQVQAFAKLLDGFDVRFSPIQAAPVWRSGRNVLPPFIEVAAARTRSPLHPAR